MTSRVLAAQIIANPMIPEAEAAAFLAADEHWDGLAHYWRKLLPSNVYKVIEALIEHTRFDVKTWQTGNPPMPAHERLADLAGIGVRTVRRILHRDEQSGRFTYSYRCQVYHRVTDESIVCYEAERTAREGDPEAQQLAPCGWRSGHLVALHRHLAAQLTLPCYELGDLLTFFIRTIERRRRYDMQQRRWVWTSNSYHMTPIMPLPPTAEADASYSLKLHAIQTRRAQIQEDATTARPAADAPSSLNRTSWPIQCSANLTEEDPLATLSYSAGSTISITQGETSLRSLAGVASEEAAVVAVAIGSAEMNEDGDKECEDDAQNHDREIEQDRRASLDLAAARPTLAFVAQAQQAQDGQNTQKLGHSTQECVAADLERDEDARQRQVQRDRHVQVDAIIGADLQRSASLLGDHAPQAARAVLVHAFTEAQTPLDGLRPALRLINHRFERVYGTGGKAIKKSKVGTWITTAKSVIAKGRKWGHDYAAQDTLEAHEAQVRRAAQAAEARGNIAYLQTKAYYDAQQEMPAPDSLAAAFAQLDCRRSGPTAGRPLPTSPASGPGHQEKERRL